ncbi:uncharacterized protein LOC126882617 [Diabrotica virgifera virgifera]|uniref:Reverse transcriptase domain-containing protein n=1 Tax=Diabrotica virgifera virgifera TaxID=50390 RepID=A0ABM5K031_DIAVI|nr:uncharacterized protein LOC126882617 [Diabrotica virgifera virgifera]
MAQFTILNSALTDCKTQINNLTDLVSAQSQTISTCVADISDLRKENQSLNNNLKALENKVIKLESKNVPTTSESVFQESYERLKRSENIIITGVPESNNTEDDISKASEILENVIPKNHFQIKSAARLGKIDLNKPRVFRITLNSRDQVLSILKNKYKVPKDKYPRINIISDSTPQQLQFISEVRNELTRRKDQGEENLTIKYVKGQPTIVIDGNPTIISTQSDRPKRNRKEDSSLIHNTKKGILANGKAGYNKRFSLSIEIWENFYNQLYANRLTDSSVFIDVRHPYLDATITIYEVYAALNKCKNKKSPGLDIIPYEVYKSLPHNWVLYMSSLFNKIFETGTIPKSWCGILLSMLHKSGPPDEPTNYRGLALLNCSLKIFTNILQSRLSSWCEEYHILPESQAGFRPGRGCIDNVYTLSSVIQFHIRQKKTSFDVTAGVLQGETLSPLLFSLFIADIETFFYGNGARGVSIDSKNEILLLLYADDLVILADSEADVGRKLKLLESYTKSNDLTVNTTKSKILICSKGGHTTNNINFFYNNNPVISTNAYNYLGVTFTKSSLFREMSYTTIDKAKQALGSILPILTSSKIDSWSPRIKLFESLALSVMSNCAPVWALRYTEALEKRRGVDDNNGDSASADTEMPEPETTKQDRTINVPVNLDCSVGSSNLYLVSDDPGKWPAKLNPSEV